VHITQCNGEGTSAIWDMAIRHIRLCIEKENTDPEIIDTILTELHNSRYHTNNSLPLDRATSLARDQQSDIGWGIS
jgi:hypothetical protein